MTRILTSGGKNASGHAEPGVPLGRSAFSGFMDRAFRRTMSRRSKSDPVDGILNVSMSDVFRIRRGVAALSTNLTGTNNDLVYTAVDPGTLMEDISVQYVNPGVAGSAISVSVNQKEIAVNLATTPTVAATGTLTSDNTAPADGDTVTIGTRTYTFKTTLTPTAGEVLIGASANAALTNLKAAINGEAGSGTTYATGTAVHATVSAGTVDTTAHQLPLTAKTAGTAGNSLASTETSAHLAFAAATLQNGSDGGVISSTANEVMTAVGQNDDATDLVTVALKAANDGTGVVTAMSKTYLNDTADDELRQNLPAGLAPSVPSPTLTGHEEQIVTPKATTIFGDAEMVVQKSTNRAVRRR